MVRHMKFLAHNKTIMCICILCGLLLSACGKKEEDKSSIEESISEAEVSASEIQKEKEGSVTEPYAYEVEEKVFSFSVSEENTYYIPYVRMEGCPDKALQWKINHTLWEEACWIFDCAEMEQGLYSLFDGNHSIEIVGIYQYSHYLSVVYGGLVEKRLPGEISYAIVVDTLSGERILLGDVIEDEALFKERLLHYFDNDNREIRLFIFEDDAEEILHNGHMTEKEFLIDNITSQGKYLQMNNGEISSISLLFRASSFYMTEVGFVVLPGAQYFEPLIFEWEEMKNVLKKEYIK